MKTCYRCGDKKERNLFYKNKSRPDGLHGLCKTCMNKVAVPKSKEQSRKDCKSYHERHPHKRKQLWRNWYEKNKLTYLPIEMERRKSLERKKVSKAYYIRNRDRILAKKREYRKRFSIKQKLSKQLRDRFYKVVVRMKSGKKFKSSLLLLGCSVDDFKIYLENLFLEGMNWDNHGNGDNRWNIDHIKPLVQFNLFELEEQKEAFHYTNLRPLWFRDNISRKRKLA